MILFIIAAAVLCFFYGWHIAKTIMESIIPEIKRIKGITYETLGIFIVLIATVFFIVVAIYFMVMYCEGNLYFTQSFGIDDEVKHLNDLSAV